MEGSYRDILCCDSTRNIDNALSRYKHERDTIIRLLSRDPSELKDKIWSENGLLSNDPRCMCHAGKHRKYTSYVCPPCANMNRLVDYSKANPNKPFLIECGEKVGTSFILIPLDVGNTSFDIGVADKEKAKKFLADHRSMLTCGSQDIDDLTFVNSDIFTNNILIWWIIDMIFQSKGLPYTLPLHTAYICRHKGFLLSESPTIGNFKQLQKYANDKQWSAVDVCTSICKQLGVMLDVLHGWYFTHGNPHCDVIVFSEDALEHIYDHVTVSSSFTMHMVDFTYSSITYEGNRLYPSSDRSSVLFNRYMLNIDIQDGKYKLTNESDVLFNYIRHAGLPIYSSSFDFYCFIVSFMMDPYFFRSVKSDPVMSAAWKSIWLDGEIEKIERRLRKGGDVVRTLNGLWLQCDVVRTWLSEF